MYDILEKKKNGFGLTKEEIEYVITNYTNGNILDYQMSALLMAISINGMTDDEINYLTLAMASSGSILDLSILNNTVDKHSTGGVGDKTTLIICPIVSCLNCNVAKMSGHSLGFTGGTADKLEAIGMNIDLNHNDLIKQVKEINIALMKQSSDIAPADKKIYALRDVTATVESIPLIASSIMSKKIASGSKNLVLDIKVGNGAFMKDTESATLLATKMVNIASYASINSVAVLTNMDIPLGNNVGNILEIKEAMSVLKNEGPDDLREVCITLAAYMNSITNNIDYEESKKQVISVLENGLAYQKFEHLVIKQGGNLDCVNNTPKYRFEIYSNKEGYINQMNSANIGKISHLLGGGRTNLNDKIDYTAGLILNKKTGDYVFNNDLLAILYSSTINEFAALKKLYLESLIINDIKPEIKLIYKIID